MKKYNKIIFIFIVLIMLSIPMSATVALETEENDQICIYKVTPEDPEWKSFISKTQMIEACSISSDVLSKMSTDELIDAVLSFPLLVNIYAYNNYELALDVLANDSDAYKELLTRKDAREKLLKKYKEFSLDKENKILGYGVIEIILLDDDLPLIKTDELSEVKLDIDSLYDFADLSKVYITTPEGTPVYVIDRGEELTFQERIIITSAFTSAYPNAICIGLATTVYNCHNFAWNTNTPFSYWMNNPSAYMTDGSYDDIIFPANNNGDRIYYGSAGNHSGLVTDVIPPYTPKVTSKWGLGPLMCHYESYCPYNDSDITYWREN